MNSMSVSPVKPPLNPGNLSVPPATATNLSKSSLPSNNSFTALNLVPENKGTASVPPIPTTPEKSAEMTPKVPQTAPTSNGTVSPHSDTGQNAAVPSIPNCSEKIDSSENLSTKTATANADNVVEDSSKSKTDIESKKDEKKPTVESKGSSSDTKVAASKDTIAKNVSGNEIPTSIESVPAKRDEAEEKKHEKKSENPVRPVENVQVESITSSPSKKETTVEATSAKVVVEDKKPSLSTPNKEEKEKAKVKSEPISKKKETEVAAEAGTVATEITPKLVSPPKATKRKAKTPVESITEEETADSRKSKRTRLPTQPYQSPIPELQLIAKLNTPAKTTPKTSNEKIIVAFYKSEFLAVRNPEGSFYICQAFQNIHRNSTKIKIRWFTNLPQNIYTPDFYDTTEFDCILTSVTMNRVEKDRWKLPEQEQVRIENILKRALDVEKGVAEQPSVTEEHPDGLDLSLYKDEAQLQKRKKKSTAPPKETNPSQTKKTNKSKKTSKTSPQKISASTPVPSSAATKKSPRVSSYVNRDSSETKSKTAEKSVTKKEKKDKKKKKSKSLKKQASSAAAKTDTVSSKTWEPSVKASNSSKVVLSLRKEDLSAKSSVSTETKTTKRTSSVSLRASAAAAAAAVTPPATITATTSPAKRRKEETKSSPSNPSPAPTTEKTGKVRNAGSAVSAKINSAAMRTTKEKERKTATAAAQRKK